ncbi:MAG TPA: hypothetical protein PKE32_08710 [Miltoncostaeaceae bacterium]|nr:hypothetical protein [Miltoncostaeaceae bacterium]
MSAYWAVLVTSLKRLARTGWYPLLIGAGLVVSAIVGAVAATRHGGARLDAFQGGAVSLLLLGGLVAALACGASALNRDGDGGHFGVLVGAGMRRAALTGAALSARALALAAIVVIWGAGLQIASALLGLGLDGDLALHTLLVGEALLLTGAAAAAASSAVGRTAAAIFALAVFLTAQAIVNLKAAADQDLIGSARSGVDGAYGILPHIPTSPLISDLQARGVGGPAIPRITHNGNEAVLTASGWGTVLVTLVWVALFALLAHAGMRRRPLA